MLTKFTEFFLKEYQNYGQVEDYHVNAAKNMLIGLIKKHLAFELGIKKGERPAKEILILFFKHIGFLDDSNYFNLNPREKENLFKHAGQISTVVELGLSNYGFVDYTKYKPFPLVIYILWRLKISNMGGPLESSNNSHLCEEKPVVVKVEPVQRSNGQNHPNSITGTSSIHTIVIPDDEDEHTIPYFKTPEPLGNPKSCSDFQIEGASTEQSRKKKDQSNRRFLKLQFRKERNRTTKLPDGTKRTR